MYKASQTKLFLTGISHKFFCERKKNKRYIKDKDKLNNKYSENSRFYWKEVYM